MKKFAAKWEGYRIKHKKFFRLYGEERPRFVAVRPQAGDRDPSAGDDADGAQRPLVARLRLVNSPLVAASAS
ncbi:hypothetical protein XI04_08325 [Bradyrhizobium sp. CCBAU 11430]|nr:hypothetical protein [Bradyrhizobium sp. CCBAU 11430]